MKTIISCLAGALMLSLVSCANPNESATPACCAHEGVAESNPSRSPETVPMSDNSLYQVSSVWTNDANQSVQLSDFRGKPQLITMFFATCEYACPILAHDVQRIEQALPESIRSQINVTLVSFDNERDTPVALKKFRQARKLPAHWNFLTGNPEDIMELAALLGVKYKKDARGQFAHSNIIALLNAEGELVHQQVGLNQPVDAMVKAVRDLNPSLVTVY